MKKLNRRETIILIITAALIVLFIVFQAVIKPIQEGAVDINDRLRVDEDRLLKARQMVAQKGQVEASFRSLVNLIGVSDSDDAEMPSIVAKIEGAARVSNIHIANIQPQKSDTEKQVRFLSVELEIDGQWLDVVQFLNTLQQQPNFYFIKELNLEKYSDSTNSLRGRIVISRMSLIQGVS